MKFNLNKSKLIYQVRYNTPLSKEGYTYEMLYRTEEGKYFIHFEGGKCSEYAVKVGMFDYRGRSGEYEINKCDLDIWKQTALSNSKRKPERYMVIDWEKEEDESILEQFEKIIMK